MQATPLTNNGISRFKDLLACRDARLNAKIDSAAGTVVMGTTFPTAYEQIMDNAKALSSRTFMLANAVGAVPRA